MKNILLILAITAFFIAGSAFVSFIEVRKNDLSGQNTWMLYFNQPTDISLDFTIENHSDASSFHYDIMSGKSILESADIPMKKNETRSIPVSLNNGDAQKITIRVSDGSNEKEIYKNF